MRTVVLADLHGSLHALRAATADLTHALHAQAERAGRPEVAHAVRTGRMPAA